MHDLRGADIATYGNVFVINIKVLGLLYSLRLPSINLDISIG